MQQVMYLQINPSENCSFKYIGLSCREGRMADPRYFLDAPNYLYVSRKLAQKFPDLLESVLVSRYILAMC